MLAVSRGLISRLRSIINGPRTSSIASTCHFRKFSVESLIDNECDVNQEYTRTIIAKPGGMTPSSKRTRRVIAFKCGMTALWDKWGARVPISVLWLDDNIVSQVKTIKKEGIFALQIGCGQKKEKKLRKPEVGHFRAQGVPLKRKLREFPVTKDALLPVGTTIGVQHFVPGQYVDVTGITRGKGFQGPMKKWGFKGLPETHGVSKSHRSGGSTGQRDAPGKVFKGKKMAGRMGGKQRTVKNVRIYKIDPARNLMWVPGAEGNFVFIKDAFYKKPDTSLLCAKQQQYNAEANGDVVCVYMLELNQQQPTKSGSLCNIDNLTICNQGEYRIYVVRQSRLHPREDRTSIEIKEEEEKRRVRRTLCA